MKILAIRGKNLASLEEEFEIDFTVEPLKSAGIFAITGNTGSGKSTLLDTVCLALFDSTPRVNRAGENNIAIFDVKDKTINQRDSRTILRRGTSEGYAEVDFLSLGGEKFRSTWSVKRARGKRDGSMQSAEIKLVNLSSGEEVQGTKTELLAKIMKGIGLTFDQFTRAVLLAQGDFATFLRAKQSEKAELLEKLTGTDIYSRISMMIYEKSKGAEQDLNLLKERIQDVELLSDEQLERLESERGTIREALSGLKQMVDTVSEKIKWIRNDEILRSGVSQAEKQLADSRKALLEAKPRYDYITRIEDVQEIRDTFNEFQNNRKQLESNRINLEKQKVELETSAEMLLKADEMLAAAEKEQAAFDQKAERFEPEIIKARELDVRIEGIRANATEADAEFKTAQANAERADRNRQLLSREIEQIKTAIVDLATWFGENEIYRDVVPKADLIVSMLNDAGSAKEQITNNQDIREKNEVILENERRRFTELKQEAERLNRLLPAEIMSLRNTLETGKPCPVCGSLDHPAQKDHNEESLQEKELNQAKLSVSDEITLLEENIDKRKSEITRLTALIDHYTAQAKSITDKIERYVTVVPFWQEELEQGMLQKKLTDIAGKWRQHTENLANAENTLKNKTTLLQKEEENFVDTGNSLVVKAEKRLLLIENLEKLQSERKNVLGGKSADDAAAYFTTGKKTFAEKVKDLMDTKNRIVSNRETIKGSINQIDTEVIRITERCKSLDQTIDNWISGKDGTITRDQLVELLGKDKHWLDAEKQFLNGLKEQETVAETTFIERKNNLAKQSEAEIKPEEGETMELLSEKLAEYHLQVEKDTTHIAEIELALANHHKGKEKIRAFEKELAEKSTLSANWKKLNEMFGSANGSKFKEMAQGYTLDALLIYANKHLQELSKRYELQRIPDTLALQVADLDMLGEIRTVHSLSGGESFLISLALALGLSSLSSNRMKIESLFIDEGFGSLDAETLRVAMDALEKLQTHGRKIGVISHVPEMTERITTQIRVVKTMNGKSRVEVVQK